MGESFGAARGGAGFCRFDGGGFVVSGRFGSEVCGRTPPLPLLHGGRGKVGGGSGGFFGRRVALRFVGGGVLLEFGAARVHLRLSFGGFALQAGGACFVAGARVFGGAGFFVSGADGAFAVAVVLDERYGRRADGGADAAFDAVVEAVLFEAFVFVALAVPEELLWQEFHRAGVRAA